MGFVVNKGRLCPFALDMVRNVLSSCVQILPLTLSSLNRPSTRPKNACVFICPTHLVRETRTPRKTSYWLTYRNRPTPTATSAHFSASTIN